MLLKKKSILLIILTMIVSMGKADSFADHLSINYDWGSGKLVIEVKQSGGFNSYYADYLTYNGWMEGNITGAKIVDFQGAPDADDFTKLTSVCSNVETLILKSATSLPSSFTVPTSVKGIIKTDAQTLPEGIITASRYCMSMNGSTVTATGTLTNDALDFTKLFSAGELSKIDLSGATVADPSALQLPVQWGASRNTIDIVVPASTADMAAYIGNDYGKQLMIGIITKQSGTTQELLVVSGADQNSFDASTTDLIIRIWNDNAETIIKTLGYIGRLSSSITSLDLSNVQFPSGQNISITNNNLKAGVNIGTQPVFGNFTFSDNNAAFTSYTFSSHVTGNLDLTGCTNLTHLDLTKATIDGTIASFASHPHVSEMTATVATQEMKDKLIAAGLTDSKITIETPEYNNVIVERGNYIVMYYDSDMSDFGDMLGKALTMAGDSKRVVVHIKGQMKGTDITAMKNSLGNDKSVYIDLYDVDVSEDSKMTSAFTGIRNLFSQIDNNELPKPYGIVLPKNLFDNATNSTISANEVAARCIEFGGRWVSKAEPDENGIQHGVSFMYVNSAGDTDEERSYNTTRFFNAGVDITLMHKELRQSMTYNVGSDTKQYVNISDRIPDASPVSTVRMNNCGYPDKHGHPTRDLEIVLKGQDNLQPVMQSSMHLFMLNDVRSVKVINKSGEDLRNATVSELNNLNNTLLTRAPGLQHEVSGLNIYEARWPSDTEVTIEDLQYLIVKKGTNVSDATKSCLKGYAEISADNDEITTINVKNSRDMVILSQMMGKQINDITNLSITGPVETDDLATIKQMPHLRLLDLSGATMADAATLNSVKFTDDMAFNSNVAIVLPSATKPSVATIRKFQCTGNYFYTGQQTTAFFTTENGKRVLNVWTDSYHNTLDHILPIVKSDMVLRILPKYTDDNDENAYDFMAMTDDIFSQIKQFNVAAIDFNLVNISSLGYDFTGFNGNMHYITIPTADTDKAGNPYADLDKTSGNPHFNFGSSIWTVSTCKQAGSNSWNKVNYSGATYTAEETTHVLYVTPNGQNRVAGAADYMFDTHRNAQRQIVLGTLSDNDLSSLTWMNSPRVDFTHATLGDVMQFSNEAVSAIALPYSYSGDLPSLRDFDDETDDNCPNLLAIGHFDNADGVKRFNYQSYEAGHADDVVELIDAVNGGNMINRLRYAGPINAEDVAISAYLDENGHLQTAQDDEQSDITNPQLSATEKTGALNNKATIIEADLSSAWLPLEASASKSYANDDKDGKVTYQDDLCFTLLGWSNALESIVLPEHENVWRISSNAFANTDNAAFTTICIPSNYREIGSNAFKNKSSLVHITTTPFAGNASKEADSDETIVDHDINGATNTATFSSNLERIESGAFFNVGRLRDVFVLAKKAPECHRGAFSDASTHGWGGFNSAHPITRDSYMNGDGNAMFAVLHYPKDIEGTQEEANYTDVERVYTLEDELQTTDGNGNVLVWPTYSEQVRAWNQAIDGYTWNDWKSNYSEWSIDNNYSAVSPTSSSEAEAGGMIVDPTSYNKKTGTNKFNYDAKYTGWHEFVLSNKVRTDSDIPVFNFKTYKTKRWYTICVPFNMTKSMLLDMFGAKAGSTVDGEVIAEDRYPIVRTLKSVVREDDRRHITLYFTKDLTTCGKTWRFNSHQSEVKDRHHRGAYINYAFYRDDTAPDGYENCGNNAFWSNQKAIEGIAADDPIIIYEGMPYIIFPILPDDGPQMEQLLEMKTHTALVDETMNAKVPFAQYAAPVYTSFKTDGAGNKVVDETSLVEDDATVPINYYMFVGSYHKVRQQIPLYAFFLANNNKFYMHDEVFINESEWSGNDYFGASEWEAYKSDYEDYYSWRANECIIGPKAVVTMTAGSGTARKSSTFNISMSVKADELLAIPSTDADANTVWMFDTEEFEEEQPEPDGIKEINTTDIGQQDLSSSDYFDLQGRKISNAPVKGIYIHNNRKYAVSGR